MGWTSKAAVGDNLEEMEQPWCESVLVILKITRDDIRGAMASLPYPVSALPATSNGPKSCSVKENDNFGFWQEPLRNNLHKASP